MRAVNADYLIEEIDATAPYEDNIAIETVKKIIKAAPTITGIEWHSLAGDDDIPERVLLLVSFANAAAIMTGYYEDGVFRSPADDVFRNHGLVVNAWCIAPQGYES